MRYLLTIVARPASVRRCRKSSQSRLQVKGDGAQIIDSKQTYQCRGLYVYRFAELLKERLPGAPGEFEIQDHIKNPNKGGYRALHVNFRLDIGSHAFAPDRVSCEVQIRSRLQDAWAKLSHDDIYKQPDLPGDLRARAKDLAEILTAADRIASVIRTRVTEESIPPEQRPSLRRVSSEGLAFLFKETFGRSPPDYVIRRALNVCGKLGIDSLEGLPAVLGREEFRRKVADAYQAVTSAVNPIGGADMERRAAAPHG